MSFSFSKIGTKLSLAKHLMSKESQLADDPKSLAAILPLLTGADDSTNYELTASGHGGHVDSLTLRSVGAIVTVLLVLAVASTAHARWHIFGRNSGCQQQAACPCRQPAPCPCDPTPPPPPKPIPAPPVPAPAVPVPAPTESTPHLIPPVPTVTMRQCSAPVDTAPTITVYTLPGCGPCMRQKAALKAAGLTFQEETQNAAWPR